MNTQEYMKYKYEIENNKKKWCYDCENFFHEHMCGYSSCNCKIYGVIDCNQTEIHPDKFTNKCKYYNRSNKPLWIYKYISAYDALKIGLIKE